MMKNAGLITFDGQNYFPEEFMCSDPCPTPPIAHEEFEKAIIVP
jgi:hypothetical protein